MKCRVKSEQAHKLYFCHQRIKMSISPGLISITKAQVPSYLVGSEFYNLLDDADGGGFTIPAQNLKHDLTVNEVADAEHLLSTLQFWGVTKLPADLVAYMIYKHNSEHYEQVCRAFSNFPTFSTLLDSYRTSQKFHGKIFLTAKELQLVKELGVVTILTRDILGCDEAKSEQAGALLEVIAKTHQESLDQIFLLLSNSSSEIRSEIPVCNVRNYAKLLVKLMTRFGMTPHTLHINSESTLSRLLSWDDEQTVEHACDVLCNIVKFSSDNMWMVYRAGLAPRFVQLLSSPNAAIQSAAHLTVGHFAVKSGGPVTQLIELGIVPVLKSMLSGTTDLANRTCWVLGNIIVDSTEAFQAVLDAGVIEEVLLLYHSGTTLCAGKVSWVLHDAAQAAEPAHLPRLLDMGIVRGLCSLLTDPSKRVLVCALAGLCCLIRTCKSMLPTSGAALQRVIEQIVECGGLEAVRNLRYSQTVKVRTLAGDIIADSLSYV